ncbi:MAG: HEAT repeat domain-containing protein [Halobacteriales archaeon]
MSDDAPDPDDLRERLDALAERLEEAEVEDDYQAVEDDLTDLEADVEAMEAALDEDADDEDREPVEAIVEEVDDLAETLEAERGPYAEDVVEVLEAVAEAIAGEEWTDDGEATVLAAVGDAIDDAAVEVDADAPEDVGGAEATVGALAEAVAEAGLDPDEDAEAIASLLETAEALADAIDGAETWDDLSVREKLEVGGFYDVLDHRKDYPPEWAAIKAHEQAGNIEMILLAYDLLDSEFMTEHCLEAFKRLGSPAALDAMMQQAQRRDRDAIEVLGRIGDDEPVEMLVGFIEEGPARPLELTILRALGMIGSLEATQTVANRLLAEDPLVRSTAARALGMIGDPRAVDPLASVLEDDEAGNVRASAAWALNAIGTEAALEAAGAHAEDRAYLVEVQARRARDALEAA